MTKERKRLRKEAEMRFEKLTDKITGWIGSKRSVIAHSLFFLGMFALTFFGVHIDTILLVLTTVVSLEAIYMSIFIQMTVNRHTDDLEEIQEDVAEIEKDIDEIQADVDEIQEDVVDIEKGIDEDEEEEKKRDSELLNKIETTLGTLMKEIEELKRK